MTEEAPKPRVLFLCTGNSCRSQMAEAILRQQAGDRFEACSAGLAPKPVHPMTIRVLREAGLPTAGLHSKGTDEFLGHVAIHCAIFVCDAAQRACPRVYPFAAQSLSWPFEDPAAFEGPEDEKLARFRAVRDQIEAKIKAWLAATAPHAVETEAP